MNDFTVIFDMDGVIVDSEKAYQEIEWSLYRELGIPVTPEEHRQFIGTSEQVMWHYMKEKYDFGPAPEAMMMEERRRLLELLDKPGSIPPMEGIKDLIKSLDHNDIRMWVASSSTRIIIEKVVQKLDIQEYFTGIVSGDDVKRSKPAPDIFLLVAEKAGEHPANCLVIEDSENGIQAALAAGMKVIGLLNPNSGKMDLSAADMIIENLTELSISSISDLIVQK